MDSEARTAQIHARINTVTGWVCVGLTLIHLALFINGNAFALAFLFFTALIALSCFRDARGYRQQLSRYERERETPWN